MKNNSVIVAGVSMLPFKKPREGDSYVSMGADATRQVLVDAGVSYEDIQQAYVGWVYGDSTAGQAALYEAGMTGIPIINVNNNCATGSTALFLARQAIASGAAECVLALGFEQMAAGALDLVFADRPSPLGRFMDVVETLEGPSDAPMAPRLFGGAGHEYQREYGVEPETFAKVRVKASLHAEHNPRAIFREALDVDKVMASANIYGHLTRLQCCPPTCGAAAAILCSESFARRNGLSCGVTIAGQAMTTDFSSTFDDQSLMKLVGLDMTREAAARVYEQSGLGPEDIDVVELHDCFTSNEVITYDGLGLCATGEAEKFILDGDNSYGGRVVTNPSGGLLSKGHPLGATGLAQCAELVWQLRGECGKRQVEGARTGLQHNLGLGGACVVTMFRSS